MTNDKAQTSEQCQITKLKCQIKKAMTNDKAQNPKLKKMINDKVQNPNERGIVLALKHLNLDCHLDFDLPAGQVLRQAGIWILSGGLDRLSGQWYITRKLSKL
jgi:hypothetical protein